MSGFSPISGFIMRVDSVNSANVAEATFNLVTDLEKLVSRTDAVMVRIKFLGPVSEYTSRINLSDMFRSELSFLHHDVQIVESNLGMLEAYHQTEPNPVLGKMLTLSRGKFQEFNRTMTPSIMGMYNELAPVSAIQVRPALFQPSSQGHDVSSSRQNVDDFGWEDRRDDQGEFGFAASSQTQGQFFQPSLQSHLLSDQWEGDFGFAASSQTQGQFSQPSLQSHLLSEHLRGEENFGFGESSASLFYQTSHFETQHSEGFFKLSEHAQSVSDRIGAFDQEIRPALIQQLNDKAAAKAEALGAGSKKFFRELRKIMKTTYQNPVKEFVRELPPKARAAVYTTMIAVYTKMINSDPTELTTAELSMVNDTSNRELFNQDPQKWVRDVYYLSKYSPLLSEALKDVWGQIQTGNLKLDRK